MLARWFAANRSPAGEPVVGAPLAVDGDWVVDDDWTMGAERAVEDDRAVSGGWAADGAEVSEGDRRSRTSLVAALDVAPGWVPAGVLGEADGR